MDEKELEREEEVETGEVEGLAKLIQGLKEKETDDTEEAEESTTETKETVESKVTETEKETVTKESAKTFSEDELNAELERRMQERIEAVKREASQGAYDAAMAKFKRQEEAAAKKLKEYEVKAGMPLDKLLEAHRNARIESLVQTQGYTEETAKEIVARDEKLRQYEMSEAQRQNEIKAMKEKDQYRELRDTFYNDAKSDPAVVKLAKKYQNDIDEFAHGAIEQGNPVHYDVARDFILGKHLPELLKEQQAEIERIKTAQEQKTLANVQKRAKATPESGGVSVESTPTVSRAETAFLKKLGMDDKDIADIAKRRAAKKN